MSIVSYTTVDKYIVTARCDSPLHIGSAIGGKDQVLIHPVDEKPFIQASSISGVLRDISRKILGEESTRNLFGADKMEKNTGTNEKVGNLRISDGRFIGDLKMELRPRVSINPDSGSVSEKENGAGNASGQKFEMESIGTGARFCFTVYLYDNDLKSGLLQIFAELKEKHLQIGGQKTNGSGYIALESLLHKSFNMLKKEERILWAQEEDLPKEAYEHITDLKKDISDKDGLQVFPYEIKVYGKTEGELLIKSIALTEYGKDAPGVKNIQNAEMEYIIPGSSLKGVLRSRMTYIAKQLKKEALIEQAFGYVGNGEDTGFSGSIFVKDTVVGKRVDNDHEDNIQHRIHVDKFTAGVMHGGLFSEKNIAGEFCMEITSGKRYRLDKKEEVEQKQKNNAAQTGLLILALRDLAAGLMNVGSGYNVGKGFVDVSRVEVIYADWKAEISFAENRVEDDHEMIQTCLRALKEWEKGGEK